MNINMDSLRFRYEEHFNTFESFMSLSEGDSQSAEGVLADYTDSNIWDWEKEEEINGDVAVIPTSSLRENTIENNSPPVKEDYQKIMNDWQQLINFENEDIKGLSMDIDMVSNDQFNLSEPFSLKSSGSSLFDLPDLSETTSEEQSRVNRGGKRLDLASKCYMVDKIKEEVDSESENIDVEGDFQVDIDNIIDSKPSIIQTHDTGSLLELFEAKIDQVIVEQKIKKESASVYVSTPEINLEVFNSQNELPAENNSVKNIKKEPNVENTSTEIEPNGEQFQNKEQPSTVKKHSNTKALKEVKKNNDELPTELINKIKASNKRRSIAVIDVLPNTKRVKTKKIEENATTQKKNAEKSVNKKNNTNISIEEKDSSLVTEWIHLDHDYCGSKSTHSRNQKKDSGFESAEEDEQRSILKNQPTVKRADGKLMISLLKVNTIKNITNNSIEAQKKRKLNLEEYKKRREGLLKSYENSQNSSPLSSGQCSPAIEDENVRRLKHQEKLLQMAAELLKSSPKSKKLENSNLPPITDINTKIPTPVIVSQNQTEKCDKVKSQNKEKMKDSDSNKIANTIENIPNEEKSEQITPEAIIPKDLIAKTIVSIGVSTDFIKIPLQKNKQIDVSPIKQLEEIKPILENANGKISSNSLIASVIENIQNKVKILVPEEHTFNNEIVHGEDRTIIYLSKNREIVKTRTLAIQTDFSEDWIDVRIDNSPTNSGEKDSKHRRQREEKGHEQSVDRSSRSSSLDSRYSNTSTSSSRSRSISPQRIPVRKRQKSISKEHLRAVEERRIVYVGGISSRTTREDLRRRFQKFGPITNISIHFRDYGDNYGFVTFMYNVDAYEAVEHGNDDPTLPQYDLSFGGRRIFCRTRYSDLDDIREEIGYAPVRKSEESFDNLLREMQAKLCKRKTTT